MIFKPFKHLSECTGKRVVFYQVQSNAAEIEAMRSGRLHVGGFSTGPTAFAVNIAGAVPSRSEAMPTASGLQPDRHRQEGQPVPEADRPEGQEAGAHRASSNSGHMAPVALFPKEGLTPDKDYKVIFSASTTSRSWRELRRLRRRRRGLGRVQAHGRARPGQGSRFPRDLPQRKFPTSSFAYAHDLEPKFRDQMLRSSTTTASRRRCPRPSTAPTASIR